MNIRQSLAALAAVVAAGWINLAHVLAFVSTVSHYTPTVSFYAPPSHYVPPTVSDYTAQMTTYYVAPSVSLLHGAYGSRVDELLRPDDSEPQVLCRSRDLVQLLVLSDDRPRNSRHQVDQQEVQSCV